VPDWDESGTIYQVGDLPSLAVRNTLPAGAPGAGTPFNVTAVAVDASIKPGEVQYFAFHGTAGQLMTFQIISRDNTLNPNPILPALEVLDSSGNLVQDPNSASGTAFNVHEFESGDSTLLDVTLPATGTYYVGVLDQPVSPAGDYQLFMYSFATGTAPDSKGGYTPVRATGKDAQVISVKDLTAFAPGAASVRADALFAAPPPAPARSLTSPSAGDRNAAGAVPLGVLVVSISATPSPVVAAPPSSSLPPARAALNTDLRQWVLGNVSLPSGEQAEMSDFNLAPSNGPVEFNSPGDSVEALGLPADRAAVDTIMAYLGQEQPARAPGADGNTSDAVTPPAPADDHPEGGWGAQWLLSLAGFLALAPDESRRNGRPVISEPRTARGRGSGAAE
jgi:hypothetical protein